MSLRGKLRKCDVHMQYNPPKDQSFHYNLMQLNGQQLISTVNGQHQSLDVRQLLPGRSAEMVPHTWPAWARCPGVIDSTAKYHRKNKKKKNKKKKKKNKHPYSNSDSDSDSSSSNDSSSDHYSSRVPWRTPNVLYNFLRAGDYYAVTNHTPNVFHVRHDPNTGEGTATPLYSTNRVCGDPEDCCTFRGTAAGHMAIINNKLGELTVVHVPSGRYIRYPRVRYGTGVHVCMHPQGLYVEVRLNSQHGTHTSILTTEHNLQHSAHIQSRRPVLMPSNIYWDEL